MKTISWKTTKGTEIKLELLTEKEINADGHKVTVKAFELKAWAGSALINSPTVKIHPKAGPCLNDRNDWAPIALNVLADVEKLVDGYWAEMVRREEISEKNERDYQVHHNSVLNAMAK